MRPLTPLCELAKKYETDKGGRHLRYGGGDSSMTHEYTPVYHDLLAARRFDVMKVLELGVNSGASLRMWREFFPNAFIVGVDSNAATLIQENRIACYPCDLGDREQLCKLRHDLIAEYGYFDLIIDDASHDPGHQLLAVREWPYALAKDGILVIEDIGRPIDEQRVSDLRDEANQLLSIFHHAFLRTEVTCGQDPGEENLLVIENRP